MNKQEWNEGLNHIDADLVETYVEEKEKYRKRRNIVTKCLKACAVAAAVALVLSGIFKQQRISYGGQSLGDSDADYLNADTVVVNNSTDTFGSWFPVYWIKERYISAGDYLRMKEALNLSDHPKWLEIENNMLDYGLVGYTDHSRGYFTMTEEEAVEKAWELFNKIPFIEGEYECAGIMETYTISSSEGTFIDRAGITFFRVLDGIRVVGDSCTLYFDGSGLVEIRMRLYDYYKFGVMKMVPLEDAVANIKTPDDFYLDAQIRGPVETLEVNKIKLRYVNQYRSGCKILQPVYAFTGTATLKNQSQANFTSVVIAIPEIYTYEKHRG